MEDAPSKFKDPLFTRLFMLAEISKFTPEEKKQYDKSIENMGDYLNTITTAVEDAKAVGIAIGREEHAIETAQTMLTEVLDVELVAECTGLTLDEVQALQQQ